MSSPKDDVLRNEAGDPILDFADREAADDQAKALKGTVEPIGTAFHVNVPEGKSKKDADD